MLLEHPVLDDLAASLGREYLQMLAKLNAGISNVLRRSHGLTKSEGLYIIPGGLSRMEGSDLLKAANPPAQPKQKMSEAEAKRKKQEGPKDPGSRGGKWWRDKHGHVRYGEKPEDDGGSRKWKPIPEEEVSKLHHDIHAVMNYHGGIRATFDKMMRARGVNTDMLMQVFRDANSAGVSAQDYWAALAADAGIDEADAHEAFTQVLDKYKKAMEDDVFREAARKAIKARMASEMEAGEAVKASKGYSDEKGGKFFSGDVKSESIRLIGLMADMKLLHIPRDARDAADITDGQDEARKLRGSIVNNLDRLSALYSRLGDLNLAQTSAAYTAQVIRDMREAGIGYGKTATPDDKDAHKKSLDAYFKDENGNFKDTLLATGDARLEEEAQAAEARGDDEKAAELRAQFSGKASDVERTNQLLNSELETALGMDDLGQDERDSLVRRVNELAYNVFQQIDKCNRFQGGHELEAFFRKEVDAKDVFKSDAALHKLSESIAEKQARVASALDAQKDLNFETPEGMKKGFTAEGTDLIGFQRQALNWMKTIKRGILAYDTGMGKTPMSISFIAHLHEQVKAGKMKKEDARGVMVMPLGLTAQWPGEIKRFFPDAKVVVIGDDIKGSEDRIRTLNAIQSGELEADFVILSSSVVNFTSDTQDAVKKRMASDETINNAQGEVLTGLDRETHIKREAAKGDALCKALKSLKGCVFFDEAHHETQGLKKAENVRNAAARHFLDGREHSFLLTATPMPNGKPHELFELMDLASPGCAGPDVTRFENSITNWEEDPETGKMTPQSMSDWGEMASNIAPHVFRRSKLDKDVMQMAKDAGLPLAPLEGDDGSPGGNTHGLVAPPIFNKLFAAAGEIKPHDWTTRRPGGEAFEPASMKNSTFAKESIQRWQRSEMSVTPKMLLGDGSTPESQALWKKYGYNGEEPKLEHLAGLVAQHFDDPKNIDKPIVVFSSWPGAFKYAKQRLAAMNIDPSLMEEIHGDVPPAKRDAIQAATNAGKVKVLFVGIQAGGAGLNLQKAANKMIFLDQPEMIAHKLQALGRVWRTGRKNAMEAVRCINLYLKGTFDSEVLGRLEQKSATDIAATYHLDESMMADRAENAYRQILGGQSASALERMSEGQLQAKIDAMGLPKTVRAKDLQQKFNLEDFAKTVEFRNTLTFGQQSIETQRQLVNLKLKQKAITKEEHYRKTRNLVRAEKAWLAQNKLMGNSKALPSKELEGMTIQPEATYEVTKSSKTKVQKLIGTPVQQFTFDHLKSNGPTSLSDMTHRYLEEQVEKEAPKGKADEFARADAVRRWYDARADIEKQLKGALRSLSAAGHLSVNGVEEEEEEAPKATPKAGKPGKAAPAKSQLKGNAPPKAAKTPPPPKELTPKPKVNYTGGWTFKPSGAHTSTPAFKKEKFKVGDDTYELADIVALLKKKEFAPTSFKKLKGDFGLSDSATKKLVEVLHTHGVLA